MPEHGVALVETIELGDELWWNATWEVLQSTFST